MKLMLEVEVKSPAKKITYSDRIFLIGSCFTEHIGKRLEELKFPVLQNPNGILFVPLSVAKSLNSYVDLKKFEQKDLFFLNELWQSWNHHSVFSGMDSTNVLLNINLSQRKAHEFLKSATWVMITLGSSFSYQLTDEDSYPVANCHRAPSQWFNKYLLKSEETVNALTESIEKLKIF